MLEYETLFISVAAIFCLVGLLIADIIVMCKTNKKLEKVIKQYEMLESLGIIEKYGLDEEQVKEVYKENNNE